jgi:hypothetical protein
MESDAGGGAMEPFFEVLKAWGGCLPYLGIGVLATLAVATLMRRAGAREIGPIDRVVGRTVLLGLALAVGYTFAWGRMALFDDAYISLRYARNFADGNGLVWNIGEQVEGYTNYLWTVLLGLSMRFSSLGGAGLAIGLSLAVFGGNILAVAALGHRLNKGYWIPLAALATAGNWVFSSYGTTGMETGLCAFLVLLGLYNLIAADKPGRYALAGLFFIGAALTRPDHGLFYAIGSGIIAVEELLRLRRGDATIRESLVRIAAWSAPFLLYIAYVVWKLDFYGHLLPNTYYAKSADLTWWSQGALYAVLFWLGANAWGAAIGCVAFAKGSVGTLERRFSAFSVASLVLYTLYTARVGGDFMYGRFFVTLIPLVLLGCEALVFRSLGRPVVLGLTLFAMVASAAPVTLFEGTGERWGVVDENKYWRVQAVRPEVKLGAVHYKLGRFLRDEVVSRGIEPILGSGGIGMVGYYSGLTIVDSRGLTDPVIARQPLAKRNRPGHEKVAPREYLLERGVHLLRLKGGQRRFHPKRFRKVSRFSMRGAGIRDDWQIAHYDRAMMKQLADVPGIDFVDFDLWLDRYVAGLEKKKVKTVRGDLPWLRSYWFDHNHDPERLALIEAKAAR